MYMNSRKSHVVNNAGFWVGIEWEGMLGDVMKLSVLPSLPPSLLYPIVIIINVHLNCPHGCHLTTSAIFSLPQTDGARACGSSSTAKPCHCSHRFQVWAKLVEKVEGWDIQQFKQNGKVVISLFGRGDGNHMKPFQTSVLILRLRLVLLIVDVAKDVDEGQRDLGEALSLIHSKLNDEAFVVWQLSQFHQFLHKSIQVFTINNWNFFLF